MSVNNIEVNISSLTRDIESLRTTLASLRSHAGRMRDSVHEMDQMWDGIANAAFNQQFQIDNQSLESICKTLEELIGCMEYARDEYQRCEQSVDAVISAINI